MATEKQKQAARRNLEKARAARAARRNGLDYRHDQVSDSTFVSSQRGLVQSGPAGKES